MMVDFMKWALTDGQKFAGELGYAPLPKVVVDAGAEGAGESEAVGHAGSPASAPVPTKRSFAPERARSRSSLIVIVVAIGVELYRQSMLSIEKFGWTFWTTDTWDPVARRLRGAPVHLGHALFVGPGARSSRRRSRSASPSSSPSSRPNWLRLPLMFLTELLAAIPSIVYGLWGIFVLVPLVRAARRWPRRTGCASMPLFTGPPLGVGMLSAALILAIMVIPFTSSVAREVLKSVPAGPARGRLRARRHAVGSHPHGALLRPHRHRRRHHARLRPRARRDDGRDDGDRQQPAGQLVAVRAAVHDGGGASPTSSPKPPTTSTCSALVEIGLVLFVITLIVNAISRLLHLDDEPGAQATAGANRSGARRGERGMTRNRWRRFISHIIVGLCAARRCWWRSCRWPSSSSSCCPRACQSLNLSFFTEMPKPVGEAGGGMANAIVGTLMLVGARGAVRDSDRHRERHLHVRVRRHAARVRVRFAADTLNGVPSIVIGVFVYGIAVLPFRQFSALAGGLALGVMMIPIITRTTEELLLLVPGSLRKARWRSAPPARARSSRSCSRRRSRASSPASCSRSRASPARPRRCSSPRSTTGSSART